MINSTLGKTRPAAAYIRITTDAYQYSTANQLRIIRKYARRQGMQIIKKYSDAGKNPRNCKKPDSSL